MKTFEAYAVIPPGLEKVAAEELLELGIEGRVESGGIELKLGAEDLVDLHLWCRIPTKILVRAGRFKAFHLKELSRGLDAMDWSPYLSEPRPIRVKVTTKNSKIYHTGAVTDRVLQTLSRVVGEKLESGNNENDALTVMVRIEHNRAQVSLDASGWPLWRRAGKVETAKAPLRQNLAAGILRLAGYKPGSPLIDPMCGSGTIPIEAALWSANIAPGLDRSFSFEQWPSIDTAMVEALRDEAKGERVACEPFAWASDRDAGAVEITKRNAKRAGVSELIDVREQAFSYISPQSRPGLVLTNAPYGARIGANKNILNLYAAFGKIVQTRFSGWRVGIITNNDRLAYGSGIKGLKAHAYLPHGGLKIRLFDAKLP